MVIDSTTSTKTTITLPGRASLGGGSSTNDQHPSQEVFLLAGGVVQMVLLAREKGGRATPTVDVWSSRALTVPFREITTET